MSSAFDHIEICMKVNLAKRHLKPYVFLEYNLWQSKDRAALLRDGAAVVTRYTVWSSMDFESLDWDLR